MLSVISPFEYKPEGKWRQKSVEIPSSHYAVIHSLAKARVVPASFFIRMAIYRYVMRELGTWSEAMRESGILVEEPLEWDELKVAGDFLHPLGGRVEVKRFRKAIVAYAEDDSEGWPCVNVGIPVPLLEQVMFLVGSTHKSFSELARNAVGALIRDIFSERPEELAQVPIEKKKGRRGKRSKKILIPEE